ncbi:MAG: STAS domain-containing protein [Thermoguttaceae bacterium]|nr:STAS domain-containing protein [Thermoguttaceae bacterium]
MLTYRHLGVWKDGDITVVRFGDHRILDEVAIDKIGEELYAVASQEKCQKLLLNFAGVERLSTLMLGKLLMLNRKMQSKGGQLKLCDVDPQVRDVLASTRLDQILEICESEADARRSFAT